MSVFNFADSYRAAGLTPGPEIGLRQKPFDTLVKQMNMEIAIDLTRLYFGLPVPQGTEWFREAFAKHDPSFSMVENEQEAAVLSSCLLRAAISNKYAAAALAILTVSAGGNRKPLVLPELIEEARISLINIARDNRQHQATHPKKIQLLAKTDAVDTLVASPDWPNAAAVFKQVNDENVDGTASLASQVQNILTPIIDQIENLQEEVEMLWWHIGGWSRVLEKPFIDLKPGLAAVMAGLDLADLSKTLTGPVAASAILHRTVLTGDDTKTSIKEAVNICPTESLEKLKLGDELKNISDICPVLTGFLKAYEIGESPAWENAFKKAALIDPSVEFDLLDIAMQVFRERSLLAAFD